MAERARRAGVGTVTSAYMNGDGRWGLEVSTIGNVRLRCLLYSSDMSIKMYRETNLIRRYGRVTQYK